MAAAVKSSAGKHCIFSRFAESGWTPRSSQKGHMRMNSRRAVGEHSATCSEVQNSGLIVRMRAMISAP
ncbi:hypothetical protein ABAZ39_16565 (plasmid) [Azospirillum argentinense]|uniref:Uncharacterized protein n=1 Tax=Azospirillum argentinense TaxID=2970906 RepID=A0A060DL81_9PROT|nr:hypothetical protein ABAZ39_16565 [Azospirillum argentinense]EZQ06546.1 hypothetical protein ABAZ39_21560 [Azospirillum argentinense]